MHTYFVAIVLSLALTIFALPAPEVEGAVLSNGSFSRRHLEPLIGLIEDKNVARAVPKPDEGHEQLTALEALFKRINRGGRVNRRDMQLDDTLVERTNRGGRIGRQAANAERNESSLSKRINRGGRTDRRDAEMDNEVEPLSKRVNRGGRIG